MSMASHSCDDCPRTFVTDDALAEHASLVHPDSARAFGGTERKKLAKKGAAQKDGSFPIKNATDLRNAIQAFGRSKNKAATKRHIISRAKALGLTRLLPEGWDTAMATPVACTHEGCQRAFLDQSTLQEHAAAVHTLDDIKEALRKAVREQFLPEQGRDTKFEDRHYIFMQDAATDWVVYVHEVGEHSKLMRVGYAMDDSGKVTFTGEPYEVVRKTVYERVVTTDPEA